MPPRGGPQAARVRAARAYADLDVPDLAEPLGWSKETLSRVERGARTCNTDELKLIAEVTGVPLGFLEDGFQDESRNGDRALTELRAAVTSLVAGQLQLQRELQEIRDTGRRRPRQADEP